MIYIAEMVVINPHDGHIREALRLTSDQAAPPIPPPHAIQIFEIGVVKSEKTESRTSDTRCDTALAQEPLCGQRIDDLGIAVRGSRNVDWNCSDSP